MRKVNNGRNEHEAIGQTEMEKENYGRHCDLTGDHHGAEFGCAICDDLWIKSEKFFD